jgi:hypothetical protein
MHDPYVQKKHKVISTLIVTVGAFIGFQAVSYVVGLYQLNQALFLSFYIYIFHVLWLMFVFDLHLKKRSVIANLKLSHQGFGLLWRALLERFSYMLNWHHFRHFQNHLVLPGLIYWATIVLIYLNPFNYTMKQVIILAATACLNVAYWYMKEHVTSRMEARVVSLRLLALVKLFTAFMIYSAVMGVTIHFGYSAWFLGTATGVITFLLMYQALFQHDFINLSVLLWILIVSSVMAGVSMLVYQYWNTQYFAAGLVMLAVYNSMWGLLHHHLEKTLTGRIALEYLAMTALVISLLLGSHNFDQRVV